jgi:hypothetical protein
MALSDAQRDELEELGSRIVTGRLASYPGTGRGADIGGFTCGSMNRGDIEDWLREDASKRTFLQRAGSWLKIIAALVTVLAALITFWPS